MGDYVLYQLSIELALISVLVGPIVCPSHSRGATRTSICTWSAPKAVTAFFKPSTTCSSTSAECPAATSNVLGKSVTPRAAVDLIENWLKESGLR